MDERKIFLGAFEIKDPVSRSEYLDRHCGVDSQMRTRIEALLRVQAEERTFLQEPFVVRDDWAIAEQAGSTIGRYELLEEIGEGGFGVVYMAEQQEPVQRRVALKIIKLGMDTQQVIGRFEAERQALAMMDHPNIANILDGGSTEGGRPYFVMELVKGLPITEFCDENRMSIPERLNLFRQVCDAVQHAHQKGIIHRDIKPSNVLVGMQDGKPVPKVIDFGVAKATQQRLTEKTVFTRFQQMIGTPAYMSPEQSSFNDLDVDTRSDIYSLGVLLYELLTGVTPLDLTPARNVAYDEICRLIREDEPQLPSATLNRSTEQAIRDRRSSSTSLQRIVRGDLDWIVMKALEKDRSRRYETASAFKLDLENHLANLPVSAGPPGATYRLRKFVRRNRGLVAAAATLTIAGMLAVSSLGVAGWVWLTKSQQLNETVIRLHEEAARADENLSEAHKVVADYLTDVSESPELLRHAPGTQRLRKELLARARDYYQLFVSEDDPTASKENLATARFHLANAMMELGELHDATREYREAIQLYGQLAREQPTQHQHYGRLAQAHNNLGLAIWETGQTADAEREFDEARTIHQRLAASYPNVRKYRSDLAKHLHNQANIFHETGRHDAAVQMIEQAISMAEAMESEDGSESSHLEHLQKHRGTLGLFYKESGRTDEAREQFRMAIATCEQLIKTSQTPEYLSDLSGHHGMLALIYLDNDEIEKARKHFKEATTIAERLVKENPSVPSYQHQLSIQLNNRARLFLRTGDIPSATVTYQSCVTTTKWLTDFYPSRADYWLGLMESRINLGGLYQQVRRIDLAAGEFQQAIDIGTRLIDIDQAVQEYWDRLMQAYAQLGRGYYEVYSADEAVKVYTQALQMFERLPDNYRRRPKYRHDLATKHNSMGLVLRDGNRLDDAIRHFEQAIQINHQLSQENPDEEQYRVSLGGNHVNRADVHTRKKEFRTAIQNLETAHALLRAVMERDSQHETAREFIQNALVREGHARHEWGQSFLELRQYPDARRELQKAADIRERITSNEQSTPIAVVHLNNSRANLAYALWKLHEQKQAFRLFEQVRDELPTGPPRNSTLKMAHTILHRINSWEAGFRNELAWPLATAPQRSERDGTEALKHANKACELTNWRNYGYLDTLAAAHAELGNFDEAIRVQQQAIDIAPDDRKSHKAELVEHLQLFRRHKALRDPPTLENDDAT